MTTPSDDECIALAMLHCADTPFWYHGRHFERCHDVWYLRQPPGYDRHPAELRQFERTGNQYYFQTRGEAARAYCEYHKLISEEPHEHPPELRNGHAA